MERAQAPLCVEHLIAQDCNCLWVINETLFLSQKKNHKQAQIVLKFVLKKVRNFVVVFVVRGSVDFVL